MGNPAKEAHIPTRTPQDILRDACAEGRVSIRRSKELRREMARALLIEAAMVIELFSEDDEEKERSGV